ncbi:malonate decarboxylase subunit epsilon [Lysobacter sp. CA199]|uniref:malonate decarboxylase subunit epsilon n=1 Tax=Lysobacter sp. CA199 TaxID=3455608 RepID=UPI003F8D78EF
MSLAILCSGQGGQHPAMFDRVRDDSAAAIVLATATQVLGNDPAQLATQPRRYDNTIAQPLVCAAALAHWQALRADLPTPAVVLGYSVGELAAHAVAESFDATTCLSLAAERARLMDRVSPERSGLLAVTGLNLQAIEALCKSHGVAIAIVNGEDHVVLGGMLAGLHTADADAQARGARTRLLPVSVPAHTPWLVAAAWDFGETLRAAAVCAPRLPVLAAIDARSATTRDRVIDTLSAQIAQPLLWHDALIQAWERGARVFLELGPGNALARMIGPEFEGCQARSVEDFKTLDGVREWVATACARAQ